MGPGGHAAGDQGERGQVVTVGHLEGQLQHPLVVPRPSSVAARASTTAGSGGSPARTAKASAERPEELSRSASTRPRPTGTNAGTLGARGRARAVGAGASQQLVVARIGGARDEATEEVDGPGTVDAEEPAGVEDLGRVPCRPGLGAQPAQGVEVIGSHRGDLHRRSTVAIQHWARIPAPILTIAVGRAERRYDPPAAKT